MEDYHRLYLVLRIFGRDGDGGALHDGRVAVYLRFDLEGGDVLSPPPHSVLEPVHEVVVVVFVAVEAVAGVEPAVAPGFRRLLRHLPVADVHGPGFIRSYYQFAYLARGHFFIVFVDYSHLCAGAHPATGPVVHQVEAVAADGGAYLRHVEAGARLHSEALLEILYFVDEGDENDFFQRAL